MKFDHPIMLFIIGQILTAAGTYAAIRADLREAIVTAQVAVKQADLAHSRIDRLQDRQERRP